VGRTQCRRQARLSSATANNATAVYITAVIVTPELSSTRPTAAADDDDDATAVAAQGCVDIATSWFCPLVSVKLCATAWPCSRGAFSQSVINQILIRGPRASLGAIVLYPNKNKQTQTARDTNKPGVAELHVLTSVLEYDETLL